jgi:WD40 repeat protein
LRFAAFLPDGKTVATMGANRDQALRLWDFPSGKEIRRFADTPLSQPSVTGKGTTTFGTSSVAMAKNGNIAAAASYGGVVRLFDCATGKELQRITVRDQLSDLDDLNLTLLAFSPDGSRLASFDGSGKVRIWDAASGKEIRQFPATDAGTVGRYDAAILYAPDGKSIVTASNQSAKKKGKSGDAAESGSLMVWDAATGKLLRSISTEFAIHGNSVVFSPDGTTLAFAGTALNRSPDGKIDFKASGTTVVLADAATGKELRRLAMEGLNSSFLLFSKDGSKLYRREWTDRLIEEWDVATGKMPRKLGGERELADKRQLKTTPPDSSMALSPDGNIMVVAGFGMAPVFLDLASGKAVAATPGHINPVVSVRFSSDGKSLLTQSSENEDACKWDARTGKSLGVVPSFPFARAYAIDPTWQLAALWTPGAKKSSTIQIVEIAGTKVLAEIDQKDPENRVEMQFSPNGKILAARQQLQQTIDLFEVPTGKPLHKLTVAIGAAKKTAAAAHSWAILFSADSKLLASYLDPATIGLWDTSSGMRAGKINVGQAVIQGGAFTPDGRCLALERSDGSLNLYELATGEVRRAGKTTAKVTKGPLAALSPKTAPPSTGPNIALSPDGKFLAQAGHDHNVYLWDVIKAKALVTFKGHEDKVNSIAFAPDGKTVASASSDTTVLIWDVSKVARPAPVATALQPAELDACWQGLLQTDASNAYTAMLDLIADPKNAVELIRARLKPVVAVEPKRIEELVHQLGDEQYKVRDKATAELLKIGDQIVPVIDRALQASMPLENKLRLEELRAKLTGMLLQGQRLQAYRAAEVLEQIGTREARQLLETLASGAPGALLTSQARDALERLKK